MKEPAGERGSMLMETVIVLPLLVALIFGALQMGHIYVARQVVCYAAYSAARATLPVAEGSEEREAKEAAARILCWLVASPESTHNGVLMPDPKSRAVTSRMLTFSLKKEPWSREVEIRFAFPLVMPFAAQIMAFRLNPAITDLTLQKPDSNFTVQNFGDSFDGPHLIFHERMTLPKPYIVKP